MEMILAVIPAYNESGVIIDVIRKTLPLVDMVLVVDDGSTDATGKKLEAYNASIHGEKLRLIHNNLRCGKGYALRSGFQYAVDKGFDLVVTLDGDGEHDPSDIPRLLKALADRDIVIAQRTSSRSAIRRLLNNWSTLWVRLLIAGVKDTQCGFRAIRTDVLKKLHLTRDDFSMELEMILEAYRNNARFSFITVETKRVSKSFVKFPDYLNINEVFDRWFIANQRQLHLSFLKKNLILICALLGLMLSASIRPILKWIPCGCLF